MEVAVSLLLIPKSDTHNKTERNNRLPGVKAKQTVAVF